MASKTKAPVIPDFIPAADETLRLSTKANLKVAAQGKGKAALAAQAELDRRKANGIRRAAKRALEAA